jgi:hypothetical protein
LPGAGFSNAKETAAKERREHRENGIFRLLFSPIALDMPERTD